MSYERHFSPSRGPAKIFSSDATALKSIAIADNLAKGHTADERFMMSSWSSDELTKAGYGLTTAQIVYRMPDHRHLFQDFIWQRYDTYPNFPVLSAFLTFWEETIEGPIHSVTVAHARLLRPTDLTAMRRVH